MNTVNDISGTTSNAYNFSSSKTAVHNPATTSITSNGMNNEHDFLFRLTNLMH